MRVYKVTLCIVDHDKLGEEGIVIEIENVRYPNHCMSPSVDCHMCGKAFMCNEDRAWAYCSDACFFADAAEQLKTKSYFVPYIPLQISRLYELFQ